MSNSLLSSEASELDLLNERPFSQTDHEILKSYEVVVDGLAMLIGGHCEIVLHSLEDLKCSAVRIANGEHTGRKIGSPITIWHCACCTIWRAMTAASPKPISPGPKVAC